MNAIRRLLPCFVLFLTASALHAASMPELNLQALADKHPRLLAGENTFRHLQTRSWQGLGKQYWEFLEMTGREMLSVEPVSRELEGRRLLEQSRRALKRVTTWALLYRVEGDPVFRDRAIREMEAIAAFPDWNPSHFLDVGEMALALAIGTDWLWADLTPAQRARFLEALKEKAILPSLDEEDPENWWMYYYNNWNPVCHAGLVAAALMLAEEEPDLANRVIHRAMRAFPEAIKAYQPVGAYPEGPSYWDYGTAFSAILLNLFEAAFGTTFGLDDDKAFQASGTFRAIAVAPSGMFYNYADSREVDRFSEATAWFASRYGNPAAFHEMKRGLKSELGRNDWNPADGGGRLAAFVALWYPQPGQFSEIEPQALPTSWLGKGPNPVAYIRENWEDPESLYLAFKGNDASVSHAHMDAGSFIFEDAGVRWAIDLGSQGYLSLESEGLGIWDRRQHSDRWRIFRLGPYSHNLLLIDQRLQDAETKAEISKLAREGNTIHGVVDLTPVTTGQAGRFERHFRLHDFKVLQITDVIEGARARTERQGRDTATLRWRMLTRAGVTIDGRRATLQQDGKTLYLNVRQPSAVALRADPVDPPPYYWDAPNPGVTAIDVWTNADLEGNQTVEVLMSTDKEALTDVMDRS